jgi:hypothetical protein
MKPHIFRRGAGLPLSFAFLALSFATAAPASAADQTQTSISGINYGTNGASAQACKAGTAGNWLEANGSGVEGPGRRMTLSFSTAPTTDTFRAALNNAASRDLALIEIQGADGVWRKAWEGQLPPLAPGFAQNCSEHRLPQKQVIQALRYTFRQAQDEIHVDHAALLRR